MKDILIMQGFFLFFLKDIIMNFIYEILKNPNCMILLV